MISSAAMHPTATILIVDDLPANRETLFELLRPEKYRILEAEDGPSALRVALEDPPDLVLLDVMMPGMDGFQVCQLLRANVALAEVPVIMVTALDDSASRLAGIQAGADDIITKPFNCAELRARVRTTTRLNRYRRLVDAQTALHESETRFRELAEHIQDVFWQAGPEKQRKSYVSPSFELMWGRTCQSVYQSPDAWIESIHPDDRDRMRGAPESEPIKGIYEEEYRILRPDGAERWVHDRSFPILDPFGGIKCWVGVARDVTSSKLAEDVLKASLKQVGDLNTEIQNFYHTLSHELKTPLTSAREFISIVMDGLAGPLNKSQLEYLGIAMESCDQLRLYVNDMLDVTRLETGKMSLSLEIKPLKPLIQSVVTTLTAAAAGKGINLCCEFEQDLPDVPIDSQRIQQVLANIVINAINFSSSGGQICISVTESKKKLGFIQVTVTDTGVGMPENQLEQVFNRLHQVRADASAASRNGLGLGLYICKELVHLHGGHIWAESQLGQGSSFSFTLPTHFKRLAFSVLVVDDEVEMRKVLSVMLEKAGYQVTVASDGAEALERMQQQLPSLVILDLNMANFDGAQVLEQMRKQWIEIPVIVYTANPEGDLMNRALKGAPFTLLVKPTSSKRMLDTVRLFAPKM